MDCRGTVDDGKGLDAGKMIADGIMVVHAARHLYFGAFLPHQVQLLQLWLPRVFTGSFRALRRSCLCRHWESAAGCGRDGRAARTRSGFYLSGGRDADGAGDGTTGADLRRSTLSVRGAAWR